MILSERNITVAIYLITFTANFKLGVYFTTVCKMSVEEKLRKLRGKRTLKILINSQRGQFSAEFYGKWGIRVECTVENGLLIPVSMVSVFQKCPIGKNISGLGMACVP